VVVNRADAVVSRCIQTKKLLQQEDRGTREAVLPVKSAINRLMKSCYGKNYGPKGYGYGGGAGALTGK